MTRHSTSLSPASTQTALAAAGALGLLLLSGCVTAFSPAGARGDYTETQLAPDVFRVTLHDRAFRSGAPAQEVALLRAADVCWQHGFTRFALLKQNAQTTEESCATTRYTYTTNSAQLFAGTAADSGYAIFLPGQTVTRSKPATCVMVLCFHDKPGNLHTFDAQSVQRSTTLKRGGR